MPRLCTRGLCGPATSRPAPALLRSAPRTHTLRCRHPASSSRRGHSPCTCRSCPARSLPCVLGALTGTSGSSLCSPQPQGGTDGWPWTATRCHTRNPNDFGKCQAGEPTDAATGPQAAATTLRHTRTRSRGETQTDKPHGHCPLHGPQRGPLGHSTLAFVTRPVCVGLVAPQNLDPPGSDAARAHQGQTPPLAAFTFLLCGQLQTEDDREPLRPPPARTMSEAGRLRHQGQGPRTSHAEGHQLPSVVALPQNQPCASHGESTKLNSEENEASPQNAVTNNGGQDPHTRQLYSLGKCQRYALGRSCKTTKRP